MKKRERIPIKFFVENGITKASVKTLDQVTSTKNIISVLDDCRKKREIVKSKKIKRDNYVDFVYDINVNGTDDVEKYSIVIRIKNEEKQMHYETIKYLDSLCDLSGTLRNVNNARIVAGLAIGTLILITIGPAAVKLHKENNENMLRYQQEQHEKFLENINGNQPYYSTEEERKEVEKWYYENIENKESVENEITKKTM